MANVNYSIQRKGECRMKTTKKKLFKNEVIGKENLKEYEVFATLSSIWVEPTSVLTDRSMKLEYNILQDDTTVTNEEQLLERINEMLLEINGRFQNRLSYDFSKDRGYEKLKLILKQNHLLDHQFDSE